MLGWGYFIALQNARNAGFDYQAAPTGNSKGLFSIENGHGKCAYELSFYTLSKCIESKMKP